MQLEFFDKLTAPERRQANRVVIRDHYGNPVAVFIQVTPQQLFYVDRESKDFASALKNLGISDTVLSFPEAKK